MIRRSENHLLPTAWGLLASAMLCATLVFATPGLRDSLSEQAFDSLLRWAARISPAPPPRMPVAIVDVDAASLEAVGPWPWRRDVVARLVRKAAEAGAASIAIDILFAEPDARSPAALARTLGRLMEKQEIADLARDLVDDDAALATALGVAPTVLGFALAVESGAPPPSPPLVIRGPSAFDAIWRFPGAVSQAPSIVGAAGYGAMALPGDPDGMVRRAPLIVGVGDDIRPGLGLEAVRLAVGATHFVFDSERSVFVIGPISGALPADGMLRLVPLGDAARPRVVSAVDLLGPSPLTDMLAGAVVFIGGSAPELGGLRAGADDALTPSVFFHAAAAQQILQNVTPRRLPDDDLLAVAATAIATCLGLLAAIARPPLFGAAVTALTAAGLWFGALMLAMRGALFDPTFPTLSLLAAYATATLLSFARQHRREQRIRRRFEQHLSPHVVEMIARNPSILKLGGQSREVTAFFTDIADFTGMTHRATPEQLVASLDAYFEGVTRIVIAYGGMVDKFVGDAVHAFFNAPLDQAAHSEAAVRCAIAVHLWSEDYRREALPASLGFGHTRIGIETGRAIVGDVGVGAKLDYTAHGEAVNAAARLETANKELGTRICVGPGAASRCAPGMLRQSGVVTLRGFEGTTQTFEPAPELLEHQAPLAR